MTLPFELPVRVAQAQPIAELPTEFDGAVEPKLDGWRVLLDTERGRVFGRSGTDLTSRFTDIVEAARSLEPAIIDGELLAVNADGQIEFAKIQSRSPKGPRSRDTFTMQLACFDLLAARTTDLRPQPYDVRRSRLLEVLEESTPAVRPVPVLRDPKQALGWLDTPGVEGVVLKPNTPYRGGEASGWLKWRRRHTVDLIVVGVTNTEPARQALVLAQPDPTGRLRTVGVTLPIGAAMRAQIAPLLHPAGDLRELPGVVAGLPGSPRVPYVPVSAEIVVEVEADQDAPREFGRFRHNPRLVRLRLDVSPADVAPGGR